MVNVTYGIITIGPVQSLILQARRTQDLWVGSQLLQQLVEAGIEAAKTAGAKIIAPTSLQKGSVPNRFIFQCADETTAATVIEKAHDAVFHAWNTYADRTRQYFTTTRDHGLGMTIQEATWERQINPQYWLEFYSVTHSVKDDAHFGRDVFDVLMRQIAAKKLVRSMPQHPDGEPGYKCSVTGEHEALHDQPTGKIGLAELRDYWKTVQKRQRNLALLNDGERLSAFSIVKRFGHEANSKLKIERFPSTSSIASAPTRLQMIEQWLAVRSFVEAYLTALETLYDRYKPKGERTNLYFAHPEVLPVYPLWENWSDDDVLERFLKLDGDFLYLDHLQPRPLAEHMGTVKHNELDRRLIETAREALKALYRETGVTEPSSYYAVLAMDGDHMGEAAKAFDTAEEYTTFSGGLTSFARKKMYPAVENAAGRVVYAGGDDLLALLPLGGVFAAAEAIRTSFPEHANYHTISAGIAIVHRQHPLQAAVRAAKRAEHTAKETYRTGDSGAFAFEVLRRSGEPQSGGSTWERDGISVILTLTDLRDAMINRHIAHGLASDIPELLYSVVSKYEPDTAHPKPFVDIPDSLRKLTFKRLFERRCTDQYKKLDEKPADTLREQLETIGESLAHGHGWFDVQAMTYLARFLSQEGSA